VINDNSGAISQDLRAFIPEGHASPVESDEEEDLGSNIRRGFCAIRAAFRKRREKGG
jgi:hypothetical protein